MTIQTQAIVRSLPLVAGVLGKRYGVRVEIGGNSACTDGNTIRLPALPPDGDPTLLGLVRGFVDHESAHIRYTDFSMLTAGPITPLEKHIWNCIEDWRVETALARIYPGCRTNFDWLIDHHFGKGPGRQSGLRQLVPNYLLYAIRAWDIPALAEIRDRLGSSIRKSRPVLFDGINAILAEVRNHCDSSLCAMAYALRVVRLIEKEAKAKPEPQQQEGKIQNPVGQASDADSQPALDPDLKSLLDVTEGDLPKDLGQALAGELEKAIRQSSSPACTVATEVKAETRAISKKELEEIGKASAGFHARLQALLQARKLERRVPSRRGRLDTHRLHLIRHDPRLFLRDGERVAVNTFVHLLLDCSGSMRSRVKLAAQAAYAIANSLGRIDGIRVAVTAFPASGVVNAPAASVVPILQPGQQIHPAFLVKTGGCTPMGEAIWWAMRESLARKETRKIILVVTDGCPDTEETVRQAIKCGRGLGFEFCGVGIRHDHIKDLLPGSESIENLEDLAPCLFRILQKTLT